MEQGRKCFPQNDWGGLHDINLSVFVKHQDALYVSIMYFITEGQAFISVGVELRLQLVFQASTIIYDFFFLS